MTAFATSREDHYRGHSLAVRDAFHLAVALEIDRGAVDAARAACSAKAMSQAAARLRLMLPGLGPQLEQSIRPCHGFERFAADPPRLLRRWISESS